MLLYWIWFAQLNKIPVLLKQAMLRRFHDPEEIYHSEEAVLASVEGMTQAAMQALEDKDLAPAQKILLECEQKGIGILTLHDRTYPNQLRNTADAPVVLYYKGKLPDWDAQPVIGIVGTRKASAYGMSTAAVFGKQIAACGALVVSGGAAGIDTMAMKGALEAGKPVVAVLGCGVDVVFPSQNRFLFQHVTEDGCLLSEYPPRTKGLAWHFPERNRIITGISNGLLVVEAPERSGALISAKWALDQGREVFAVPGNVGVDSCAGSNALLQDRALPALSGWDVVKEYRELWPDVVQQQTVRYEGKSQIRVAQQPLPLPSERNMVDKKAIDKEDKSTYSVLNNKRTALSETEQTVLALIGQTPVAVDDLIDLTQMSASAVKAVLTRLTIKGLTVNLPGGRVSLK